MGEYVTIQRVQGEGMAELIEQRLSQAGIPCAVVPGDLAAVAGPSAPYSVTVPPERVDEAREVLGVE